MGEGSMSCEAKLGYISLWHQRNAAGNEPKTLSNTKDALMPASGSVSKKEINTNYIRVLV
jgi:hypothetical protein